MGPSAVRDEVALRHWARCASLAETIRTCIRRGRYTHCLRAERERQEAGVSVAELETALLHGEVLEEYADDVLRARYMVLGFAGGGPIHVLCALDTRPSHVVLLGVL